MRSKTESMSRSASYSLVSLWQRLSILAVLILVAGAGVTMISKHLATTKVASIIKDMSGPDISWILENGGLPILMVDQSSNSALTTSSFLDAVGVDLKKWKDDPSGGSNTDRAEEVIQEISEKGITGGSLVSKLDIEVLSDAGGEGLGSGYVFSLDSGLVILLIPAFAGSADVVEMAFPGSSAGCPVGSLP